MEITKEESSHTLKLGELLVAANVIAPHVLLHALQMAKQSNLSLSQVLASGGDLSESDLQKTIEVKSMIRENQISVEYGIRALKMAVKSRITLEESFKRLQQEDIQEQYLLAMDLLQRTTEEDVEEAIHWLRKAAESGHAKACTELSALYSASTRIEVNLAEADKYSKLAAKHEADSTTPLH